MIGDIALVLAICTLHLLLQELIGYFYIYSKEEFKDIQEKIRNLGIRLKKLKYDFLYVPSTKKKQEGKMIKV
jgi:hypothetical protein